MRKTLFLLFLLLQVALCYGQKREFRGAWIQCVNGQFNGLTPDEMRSTLTRAKHPIPIGIHCNG